MEQDYIQILREWQDRVGEPALYENLDRVFPEYGFRRVRRGTDKDHWASPLKLDLSQPKSKQREKTVVYRADMRFREQGEWSDGVSVIDKFIQDKCLDNIYQAYARLDEMFLLDMPKPNGKQITEHRQKVSRKRNLLSALRDYFKIALLNKDSRKAGTVRSYLRGRGFTNEQIQRYNFGFVPSWNEVIRHFTLKEKYTLEEFEEACGVRNEDGKTTVGSIFTLAIPYVSGGEVRGFIFRRIGEGEGPKYIVNRGLDRKAAFFNIPESVPGGEVIVVEGEFDALKATSENLGTVVSIGGSEISGDRKKQIEDAISRGVKKITLCLDLDADKETGEVNTRARHEHIMKSIHAIKDVSCSFDEIYIAELPEVSDPDEYIRAKGSSAFSKLIKEAKPYWAYLYDYMTEQTKAMNN